MDLPEAQILATSLLSSLAPHCTRAAVAGSVRRGKQRPKDIEIVCIPKTAPADLFGATTSHAWAFARALQRWPLLQGDPLTGRYIQLDIGPCRADIFTASPDYWGLIFVLRTGPKNFNLRLLAALKNREVHMRGGLLYRRGEVLTAPTEHDLFALAQWADIPPHART